ncbi:MULTISPECIES: hypothetical protein [Pseudomonas]|uniref:hypothetical protein n=1 Tax=Pseudomonas TaxID=286 RepID=UPI00301DE618
MYEDPFQFVLMFMAAFFIDRCMKAPGLRKWLGVALFMGGLGSILYMHLETFHGIDVMPWKAFAMVMGVCLFLRRDRSVHGR